MKTITNSASKFQINAHTIHVYIKYNLSTQNKCLTRAFNKNKTDLRSMYLGLLVSRYISCTFA